MTLKNIWLIDDDPICNFLNEKLIYKCNLAKRIVSFNSVEKVIEYLNKIVEDNSDSFPDIIFLDIDMPRLTGWDFLSHYCTISERHRNRCYIYILTNAYNINELHEADKNNLIKGFLSKPLIKEDIELIKSQFYAGI